MIGYRRGYSLQQLEDMTLPSVATYEAAPMSPSVADGINDVFHFDRDGHFVSLCNQLGRTRLGDGMRGAALRYGVDYAVFEDTKLVEKKRITVDEDNGIITFVTLPLNKSGTVSSIPNHYDNTIFRDGTVNFIDMGVEIGMTIKNLTTNITGVVQGYSVHLLNTSINWDTSDEYQITGNISQPPVSGAVYTCNYYRRIKDVVLDPYYMDDSFFQSFLPSVYTVGILPTRRLGLKFSNLK